MPLMEPAAENNDNFWRNTSTATEASEQRQSRSMPSMTDEPFNWTEDDDEEEEDQQQQSVDEHERPPLPKRTELVRFYHSGCEPGLKFRMPAVFANCWHEEQQMADRELGVFKALRDKQSPLHGYTPSNARRAVQRLVKRGLIRVKVDEKWSSGQAFTAKMVVELCKGGKALEEKNGGNGKMTISAQVTGSMSAAWDGCAQHLLAKLFDADLIKEASIELYCPNRKLLQDPARALDPELLVWLYGPADIFVKKLDQIEANPGNFQRAEKPSKKERGHPLPCANANNKFEQEQQQQELDEPKNEEEEHQRKMQKWKQYFDFWEHF